MRGRSRLYVEICAGGWGNGDSFLSPQKLLEDHLHWLAKRRVQGERMASTYNRILVHA